MRGAAPELSGGFDERAAAEIEALAAHERVVAVGETGLDYYRDRAPRAEQRARSRLRSRSPGARACRW